MTERKNFEPTPRETSMLDICTQAFDKALANEDSFTLSTFTDRLGLVHEQVEYKTMYGQDSEVRIRMTRPALDTAEFLAIAEGTIDEKPKADIWVQAPRSFLFKLANGEKYFADQGFFRAVVLSDGTYLDIFSIAFSSREDDDGTVQTIPSTVGSMLRPLPPETDWVIQDIIQP